MQKKQKDLFEDLEFIDFNNQIDAFKEK